jgi:SET domain
MSFRLPYPLASQAINGIISREIKRQKISVLRASQKHLREIAEVCSEVRKYGLPKHLVRKKLPRGLGHGIFLHPDAKPLLRGRVIAPYSGTISISPEHAPDDSAYVFELVGNIRLSKEEQARFSKKLPYQPSRLYSVNLDALKKGNFTRFINHSETPNVIAHLVRIPANDLGLIPSPLQIVYFVKRKILPGEQLLVSYEEGEKSYWTSLREKPIPMGPKTFQLSQTLKVLHSKRHSK